jgi:hypothetical protein
MGAAQLTCFIFSIEAKAGKYFSIVGIESRPRIVFMKLPTPGKSTTSS